MKKERNNKGFSLVELIVVVAIMAVLIGVLAPQYLRYVERTRLQKDNSAIGEVANAIKIAMANETINTATPTGTMVTGNTSTGNAVVFNFGATGTSVALPAGATGGNITVLETELAAVIGNTWTSTSNAYRDSGVNVVLTVTTNANGVVTVEATGWINEVGATPGTHTF